MKELVVSRATDFELMRRRDDTLVARITVFNDTIEVELPSTFNYTRTDSVDEIVRLLAEEWDRMKSEELE